MQGGRAFDLPLRLAHDFQPIHFAKIRNKYKIHKYFKTY